MMLLITALVFYLLGLAVTRRDADMPLERVCYAATAGFAMWLASSWVLALTHTFTMIGLIVRLVIAIAALIYVRAGFSRPGPAKAGVYVVAFSPVILWIAWILLRGAILPPVSHDALSYHLPKATLMVRAGGFEYFPFLIPAIRTLPVNYELLLAEVIAWTGRDDLTEWVSVLFYVYLIVASGAMAERWWRRSGLPAAAVMIFTAAIPVVLLHSGAHKNDLMITAFMTASLVAIGRWITERERRALWLGVIAAASAIGTKPQAGVVALALAPFILWRIWRNPREVGALVAVTIVAFLALGGVVYIINYAHEGSFLNARDALQTEVEIVPYGDWSTLWQGPYVLLAAPFSRSATSLSVPWEARPWFWRRYEIYFSHLGCVFAIAAMIAPFGWFWTRGLNPAGSTERRVTTIAVLAAFAVILPVGFHPHGLYTISLPRYALFIVPIVFSWTIAPLMIHLEQRRRAAAIAVVMAASLLFTVTAAIYIVRDTFAPLSYVWWASVNRGTRVVHFDPNRAASIVDRAAGPTDKVAIDAGFGTWIHPAFGANLQRPVEFIAGGKGPPLVSEDADWVVVDRAYSVVWQHPRFHDLSEARDYLLRGRPAAIETRTIDRLLGDSRFEVVFYNPRMVQAVFRRVR